jgi:hypothetical protein
MQHIQASPSCIAHVEERYLKQIIRLGQEACRRPMPMICVPPLPQKPFAFGDLVPLGFLLRALRSGSHDPEIARGLTAFINAKKQGALWAFHSGHLITATDSALILLGLDDVEAVQTLQMFYDGHGGYYPQLWSEEPRPDHMLLKNSYRHGVKATTGRHVLFEDCDSSTIWLVQLLFLICLKVLSSGADCILPILFGGLGVGIGVEGRSPGRRIANAIAPGSLDKSGA